MAAVSLDSVYADAVSKASGNGGNRRSPPAHLATATGSAVCLKPQHLHLQPPPAIHLAVEPTGIDIAASVLRLHPRQSA